ncbi:hypothetical protein ACH34F_01550 [Elizabethkingia anophelis]|uniref:hypothetical protein n=1 Tax=Elizabethkingia anophelis TaxID=1117645 RepID=UPI003786FDAC
MKYSVSFMGLLFCQLLAAQYNYPKTPEIPVTDDYFGTKITDNYRWLEDLKSPEVQSWFKAQSDFSHQVIDKIPNREFLFNRMKQIQEMAGDSYGTPIQRGKFYFYKKPRKTESSQSFIQEILIQE